VSSSISSREVINQVTKRRTSIRNPNNQNIGCPIENGQQFSEIPNGRQ
jgi:hypothetical protein